MTLKITEFVAKQKNTDMNTFGVDVKMNENSKQLKKWKEIQLKYNDTSYVSLSKITRETSIIS